MRETDCYNTDHSKICEGARYKTNLPGIAPPVINLPLTRNNHLCEI